MSWELQSRHNSSVFLFLEQTSCISPTMRCFAALLLPLIAAAPNFRARYVKSSNSLFQCLFIILLAVIVPGDFLDLI